MLSGKIKVADPLTGRFSLETEQGEYVIERAKTRIDIYRGGNLVGKIYFPDSGGAGAIQLGESFAGLYRCKDDKYHVYPWESGKLAPPVENIHPLDYLITLLSKQI